jgi:hypothetical protein
VEVNAYMRWVYGDRHGVQKALRDLREAAARLKFYTEELELNHKIFDQVDEGTETDRP